MANTLTGLIPDLYEALDVVSREALGFISAVNTDHSVERAAVGQSVKSPFTNPSTATDITPGVTAPNTGDQTIGNIAMTISKSRMVPIRWNGEEQKSINSSVTYRRLFNDQIQQAFRTLSNEVEADIYAAARVKASRAIGVAGTTPFGTNGDLSDIAFARQVLTDNGAPLNDLHYVANTTAAANLRAKQGVLFRYNEAGTDNLLRRGTLDNLQGFMMHETGVIGAQVTKGTGTGYTSNGTGLPIGTTSIPLITGSGTVLAGDVVSFAGDTNKYVVATGVAAPGTIVIAAPGLRQAIPAAATAMTIGNSYLPNLGFSRNAISLATRTPIMPVDINGKAMDMADDSIIVTDPVSGLAFEVAMYKQYKQIHYEIGLAWGIGVFKPEHIVLGLG